MERIELPLIVTNSSGETSQVLGVDLKIIGNNEEPFMVQTESFLNTYEEYIDPKELRIKQLEKQLEELKAKHKKPRQSRKRLLPGEKLEIRELILKGEPNLSIAKEYEVSDSTISKIRIDMRKEGKEV